MYAQELIDQHENEDDEENSVTVEALSNELTSYARSKFIHMCDNKNI